MQTKEAIRFTLNLAEGAVLESAGKMKDAPLTYPTEKGGCHPMWVMGHLAFVEGLGYSILTGKDNPAGDLQAKFGQDTKPTQEVAEYPELLDLVERYQAVRRQNLAVLDGTSEAELDLPTAWQPPGLEEHFATRGKAFLTLAMHQMLHRGNLTDAIRRSGRS